jgi:hypothetical protein
MLVDSHNLPSVADKQCERRTGFLLIVREPANWQPSTEIDGCWRNRIGSTKMLVRISAAVELLVATFFPLRSYPR